MKRILSLLLILALCISLSGCGYEYAELELEGDYSGLEGTVLNVYNWGEYISEGSDDCIDTNLEFERITGIKVNYTTFDSNEVMYSQIKSGGVTFDIVIPSDYMIERLKNENMLRKIDVSSLKNYHYIDEAYKNLYFDPNNEYSVPYNVGMVGVIYNRRLIGEPEHSWKALWDKKYKDMSLNFSNPRDAFMTAQFILGIDLNTTKKAEWEAAAELLKKQKKYLQSYVMDEIYGKMETGEAAIGPYYAGDFLTMQENNEDLDFFYPKEGTNIFVDSICIPSTSKNYEAAMLYIDFLLEPDIALANAEYIGYASPHTAVLQNPDYYYYQNKILYPDKEDMPKVQYYHDMDSKTRLIYENLWIDVKLH
ncbi:MAG: ABC transporter substrate-binding protein [Oscillospiraceae bacterium]|nr:ABC transporter substrate-binding protein [Oscillospiraceae bacterium]